MKTTSSKTRLSVAAAVTLLFALPASGSFLQLVTPRDTSLSAVASGGGFSGLPITSPDGRYVLFTSTANNLMVLSNGTPMPVTLMSSLNVFVRDRASNTTALVSFNLAGTGGGNSDSFPIGVSTNGQYVLFESAASNLVANDTNNASDVFVRDLVNHTTTLVSVNTNGWAGNGISDNSVMTPDGRYVAFASTANNLVPNDTNYIQDVFVRDLQNSNTVLVSVGATSTNVNAAVSNPTLINLSTSPEITPGGRYVAFYSSATNLVPGVTAVGEVYVRDLTAETTTWASTNARSIFQSVTGGSNAVSCNASISADGQYVAFETCTNAPSSPFGRGLILRYDLATGTTDLVSTNASVPIESFENIHDLDMTPDGRFITFVGNVGNPTGTNTAIYLWDAQTGTNTLLSPDLNNAGPVGAICDSPVVSTNGQFVTFISDATNLTANPLSGEFHLYRRDVQAGVTALLDVDTNGVGAGVNPTTSASVSDDGNVAAFDSFGSGLVPNDNNHDYDVYVRNETTGSTELISAHAPDLPSATPSGGPAGITATSVSADGRYVAFVSDADNLVPDDDNGCRDVFVRDLLTGTNILVSASTNGISANSISTDPSISSDGRYVAFTSSANDLTSGDTNTTQDVYVRDLLSGANRLVSVSTDGVNAGNGDSFSPTLSADGRYVLFHSEASDLASGSFGTGIENLFLRDLQTGTTYALTAATSGSGVLSASMTPDGHDVAFIGVVPGISGTQLYVWNSQLAALVYTNMTGPVSLVGISPYGNHLAYESSTQLFVTDRSANTTATVASIQFNSHSGLSFSVDGSWLAYTSTNQAFLYNIPAAANLLVSKNPNTLAPGNGPSDSPVISADGRFVAYRSAASDLVTGDNNGVPDVFVYDRLNDSTTLLSSSNNGHASGDNRSLTPAFSADGRTLVFTTWASDLTADDFNHFSDVLAYTFFFADVTPGAPGEGPTISWPYVSGNNYHVEYKDKLGDSTWQAVTGTITVNGNRALLTDLAPSSGQRFYRVVAE